MLVYEMNGNECHTLKLLVQDEIALNTVSADKRRMSLITWV